MSLPFQRLASVDIDCSVLKAKDIIDQVGTAIGIPELCLEGNACVLSVEVIEPLHKFGKHAW